MSIVRTYTGKNVDLAKPEPGQICIEDIAHHLSKLDRYNGAGHFPYSVGQHSLLVSESLPKAYRLQGLLHDATEAYLGDVVSPLKAMLPEYRRIEGQVMQAICNRFKITFPRPRIIKKADQAVMAAEMMQVVKWPDLSRRPDLPPPPKGMAIRQMGWEEVKCRFLERFMELEKERERGQAMAMGM